MPVNIIMGDLLQHEWSKYVQQEVLSQEESDQPIWLPLQRRMARSWRHVHGCGWLQQMLMQVNTNYYITGIHRFSWQGNVVIFIPIN